MTGQIKSANTTGSVDLQNKALKGVPFVADHRYRDPKVTPQVQQIEEAAVRTLVNNILTILDKHHPAYTGNWHIKVDTRPKGGMLSIMNHLISPRYGFEMAIADIDPECRKILWAVGELLERFGLSRNKHVDLVDELGSAKRDFRGELIPDTTEIKG